ncbi:hypothetical protein DXG01_004140, partial [Tephrocybe rancida]
MAGTRLNTKSTTHSGLVHANALPSSRAGQKHAMSAVDDATNKKPKPAPEIKQELSEEVQGGGNKKGKGKQRAKAPSFHRQTRKTGREKKTKEKGGKWGARRTAADKALEEAAVDIPACLPRMKQALLSSRISVMPPKQTCTAATGPTAPTSSMNTCQHRADAPIEEVNNLQGNEESEEEGNKGSDEGSNKGSEEGSNEGSNKGNNKGNDEVGDTSRTEDNGGGYESSVNDTTAGPTHAPNVHELENTREPITTTSPTRASTNVHEPENTREPITTTDPTRTPTNIHKPENTHMLDVNGPTRAADVHEAENICAPNVNDVVTATYDNTRKVHFYMSSADPATMKPSLIPPTMTFKQDVISNLAPILVKTAKVYSPIKTYNHHIFLYEEGSWIAKGRYKQAIEDNEDTVEWNLDNSELTLHFLLSSFQPPESSSAFQHESLDLSGVSMSRFETPASSVPTSRFQTPISEAILPAASYSEISEHLANCTAPSLPFAYEKYLAHLNAAKKLEASISA